MKVFNSSFESKGRTFIKFTEYGNTPIEKEEVLFWKSFLSGHKISSTNLVTGHTKNRESQAGVFRWGYDGRSRNWAFVTVG